MTIFSLFLFPSIFLLLHYTLLLLFVIILRVYTSVYPSGAEYACIEYRISQTSYKQWIERIEHVNTYTGSYIDRITTIYIKTNTYSKYYLVAILNLVFFFSNLINGGLVSFFIYIKVFLLKDKSIIIIMLSSNIWYIICITRRILCKRLAIQ